MSDYIKKEIGNESPEPLEQMVAEALMRDSNLAPDADAEWQKLSARMSKHSTPLREQEPSDRQIFISRRWWTVVAAASVAAIVVVMLFVNDYFQVDSSAIYQAKSEPTDIIIIDEQNNEHVVKGNDLAVAQRQKVGNHTVVVPAGKDMKITLSDGTQVWLNENSRLTYPTVFRGKDRCVTLQGEAYFQVTHDDHHPFIVKAGGMQTRVLGTEFNVNTSDASHPHVTLVEGSVEVSAIANNMVKGQKVISPGEDATVDAHGDIKVEHVDTNDMVCWKDGIQLFDNASLREILIQLGSWYNVSVVCHDDAALNAHLRYMYDRRQGLEEAVKMLNDISNRKIKIDKNAILIE